MGAYPYLNPVVYNIFYEMLHGVYSKTPEEIAIRFRQDEVIQDVSYTRLIEEVSSIYFYLKNCGIENQNIGIFSENRYEYISIYLGTSFSNVIASIDKESVASALWQQMSDFDIFMLFTPTKPSILWRGIRRIKMWNGLWSLVCIC